MTIFCICIFILLWPKVAVVRGDTINDQIAWLRSKGGFFSDKMTYGTYDEVNPSISGLFAKENIEAKEQIMIIPKSALITGGPTEDLCETVRKLALEYHRKSESPFQPYVKYVFEIYNHEHLPSAWSDRAKGIFKKLIGNELEPQDFGELSFQESCDGSEEDAENKTLVAALRIVESRGWTDKLVPLFDMMNHRNGRFFNVDQANSVHGSDELSIVALRRIKKGEQLFISYNECHDSECDGIAESYTLAEIFNDYGFVEQYPRRFNFDTSVGNLIFDLDEDDDGQFHINWLSDPVTLSGKNWFQGHLKRLHQMKSSIVEDVENLASYEKESILEYYEANIVALEEVVNWDSFDEGIKECSDEINDDKVCAASDRYDALEDQPDPLQMLYQTRTCSDGGVKGSEISSDEVNSLYQTVEFRHFNDSESSKEDTCLYLDGWLQTCTSFRSHYHEWLVHYPAMFLRKVERVLFLGGGDNMILHEVLKYPSLSLVVGMELDQQVVRSSFKNLRIQPHFDQDIVQWWFGDATKSLKLLPAHLFGTFDLVIIDLQTYVLESLMVTPELNIMDFAMLLLKPEGILSQNEDFIFRTNPDFATYSVDIEINDVPVLCQQSINIGSDAVDFSRADLYDHNVETKVFNSKVNNKFSAWWNYRCNENRENKRNQSLEKMTTTRYDERSQGVMMVLEVEKVGTSVSLQSLTNVYTLVSQVLERKGFTLLSSSYQSKSLFIYLEEGYILLQIWEDHNYVACDIHLWSNFENIDGTKTELVAALGGELSSSFRIVTGGMRDKEPNTESKFDVHIRDKAKRTEDHTETVLDLPPTISYTTAILDTIFELIQAPINPVIAVLCPEQAANSCTSLEILSRNADEQMGRKIVPIWTCNQESFNNDDIACEKAVFEALLNCDQINGIVIDAAVSLKMGQILLKILGNSKNRRRLLSNHYAVLAPTFDSSSDSWRNPLMERFRTDIVKFSPAYHSEISFGMDKFPKANIFSTGDESFYSHLVNAMERVETSTGLSSKIKYVRDGIVNYVADFEATKIFTDTDYDCSPFLAQQKTQHPLALQSISQFEFKHSPTFLEPGDQVLVKFDDSTFTGIWYRGIITRQNEDATYDIICDDGDEMTGMSRSLIRKWEINRKISVSDKVLFLYDGDGWYQGTVLEVLPHRMYKVHVHDGYGSLALIKKLHIIRLEEGVDDSKELFSISPTLLKDMVRHAIAAMSSDRTIHDLKIDFYHGVGGGSIVTAFWTEGNAVAIWDGRQHVDLNLFTSGNKSENHHLFRNVFMERINREHSRQAFVMVSLDQQPRGFGRVVNFKHEL